MVRGEVTRVRSRQLEAALTELVDQVAAHLGACLAAGEEVPFELDSHSGPGRGAASLYCYQPLTDAFIAERLPQLRALAPYARAAQLFGASDGLDHYLLARGVDPGRVGVRERPQAALLAFLQDVFHDQTDFHVHRDRLARALERVEGAALASPAELTVVGTMHGLAIASAELRLTSGLLLAHPHALQGAPDQAVRLPGAGGGDGQDHLLVVHTAQDRDVHGDLERATGPLRELLRALRLFGDGRIALGPLAFARIAAGSWSTFALSGGGHPHGVLLLTADQEDELRAFCNLVSRRTPREGTIAWALQRFDMGCERPHEYHALSDHLLALRALLAGPREIEPEGSSSGLLAARLAELCATPEHRTAMTERTLAAIALEREVIAGTAVEHAGGFQLAREVSNHLRALLRDVICGHLPPDLVSLADELLLSGEQLDERPDERLDEHPDGGLGAQMPGETCEPGEILHVGV